MKARIGVSIYTDSGQRIFGQGPYQLLLGVERLGSLRSATQEMGMAYSKALRMIKNAEQAFAFPLIQRQIGGEGGGGSVLTPQAKQLLARYQAYQVACVEMAQALYQTLFSHFPPLSPDQDEDNSI